MEVYCWKFVQYIKETLSLSVSMFYKVHNVILVSHLQLILLTSLGYKLIDRNKCRFFVFFFTLSFLFLLMWYQRGRLLEGFTCRINLITLVLPLGTEYTIFKESWLRENNHESYCHWWFLQNYNTTLQFKLEELISPPPPFHLSSPGFKGA